MQSCQICLMTAYFGQGCAGSDHACGAAVLPVYLSHENVWVLKWHSMPHKLHASAEYDELLNVLQTSPCCHKVAVRRTLDSRLALQATTFPFLLLSSFDFFYTAESGVWYRLRQPDCPRRS